MDHLFNIGQIYKRSTIHDQYGGNRQGGIANCSKYPYIFIFSGEGGHQHGYKDQWVNDDVYSYTGEGQLNDMSFVRGNLALRDHVKNKKRVFLFKYVAKGMVRFEAELEVVEFNYLPGSDREGNQRQTIVFFFKRTGIELFYQNQIIENIAAESPSYYSHQIPNETERTGLVTSRIGQGAYRQSILHRWEFSCAVTGYNKNEILIASHIVPWKDSNNQQRLDVDNGILLSPTYDALFDRHLISFENNGKIILSDSLIKSNYGLIGITGKEKICKLTQGNMEYLERHRDRVV